MWMNGRSQNLGYRYGLVAAISISIFLLLLSSTSPSQRRLPASWANKFKTGRRPQYQANTMSPYANSRFDGLKYEKPTGFRIVGIVFAGRKEFVSILDCYLQRNLVRNGGFLDEVIWSLHTDTPRDVDYLNELIEQVPEYTAQIEVKDPVQNKFTEYSYRMLEKGTLYVKIDDDVVFWEDHAIPAIVKRKIEHPEYPLVSANVINNPALTWVHHHLGATKPYLPELTPPEGFVPNQSVMDVDWRAGTLPQYEGPDPVKLNFTENSSAPFKNHRWLPLKPGADIAETPLGVLGTGHHSEFGPFGAGWHSWAVAAQVHYSFFENLENGELWRYKFDIFDYHYERISVNFICFWGDLIIDHPIRGGDEKYLTEKLPRWLKQHAVVDGTSLAVHFGFNRQVYSHAPYKGMLNETDLIHRYKAYANEFICPSR